MSSRIISRLATRLPINRAAVSSVRRLATEPAVVSPPSSGFVQNTVLVEKPKRTGGFVRGGLLGFLLGITLAGSTAYIYLLDEYQQASDALLSSVEDLQKSTNKLKEHTQKIETLERDFKAFVAKAAKKSDVEALRSELLKVIDDVNVSHLELKTHVWEIEQDLKKATK